MSNPPSGRSPVSKKIKKIIHFIGIGGIGMSALARYFLSKNWAISGSDASKHHITEGFKKTSVNVKIGHKRANVPPKALLVVKSQAIPADNPEIAEAARRGMRILTYPEALGELTRTHNTIAIAGSHGKSTTTALVALALIEGGFDPTVIVGNNLREFGGTNFRNGKSKWLVIEADEYGRAFLHYSPFIAIVTNIDREHLDIYKNIVDAKRTFMQFLANTAAGGALVLNRDDANLRSLAPRIAVLAKNKKLRVIWYSLRGSASVASLKTRIRIFGSHNLSNAEGAFRAARFLGIPDAKILRAISRYRGAWRRMELRGIATLPAKEGDRTALVYDDYAHHPTEIRATLTAMKEHYHGRPLVCVFQPHQGKRLSLLFKEFTSAFDDADATILLPLYRVRGRDEDPARTSEDLVRAMQRRNPRQVVRFLEDPEDLPAALGDVLEPFPHTGGSRSPIVVMMGAGDIVNHTSALLSGRAGSAKDGAANSIKKHTRAQRKT